jgi:hypothetical protein
VAAAFGSIVAVVVVAFGSIDVDVVSLVGSGAVVVVVSGVVGSLVDGAVVFGSIDVVVDEPPVLGPVVVDGSRLGGVLVAEVVDGAGAVVGGVVGDVVDVSSTGSTAGAGAGATQPASAVVVGGVQSTGGSGPADAAVHATTGTRLAAAHSASRRLTA